MENSIFPTFSEEEAAGESRGVALVADDEAMIRDLVMMILQRSGYAVLPAVDGQEALEISREFRGNIDLLITDLQMPRLGGSELVKRIAAERPDTKIVLMSGYSSHRADPRLQAYPFLPKPFIPDALLSAIGLAMAS